MAYSRYRRANRNSRSSGRVRSPAGRGRSSARSGRYSRTRRSTGGRDIRLVIEQVAPVAPAVTAEALLNGGLKASTSPRRSVF